LRERSLSARFPVMGSVGVGGKTENKYKKDGLCEHQLVNKIAG
jgi:hypothetical protein